MICYLFFQNYKRLANKIFKNSWNYKKFITLKIRKKPQTPLNKKYTGILE